jgi:hypothetical protein
MGTYSYFGDIACASCKAGFICYQGSGTPTPEKYECPKGYYCPVVDTNGIKAVHKYACPSGTYGFRSRAPYTTSAEACESCPDGYFCQPGTDDYTRYFCPKGHYCPRGTHIPVECPAGTYNDKTKMYALAHCNECPEGFYCDKATTNMGTPCSMGYFCPRGSYKDQYPCPASTYSGMRTQLRDVSECIPCPAGYYCPSATATPLEHVEGYYNPYMGLPDATFFMKCPATHPCPSKGMVTWKGSSCKEGYYCPAGTVNPNDHPCPAGTFSDSKLIFDVTQCERCPRGYACTEATSSRYNTMIICPVGHYCPGGVKTTT